MYIKFLAFLFPVFIAGALPAYSQIPKTLIKVSKPEFGSGRYYLMQKANGVSTKGLVVLFPGLFDSPYAVYMETDLVQKCSGAGYTVVVPVLSQDNEHFNLRVADMKAMEVMLRDITRQIGTPAKAILGGFSAGGTTALAFFKYANRTNTGIKWSNIFAIDPPLDLVRLSATLKKREPGAMNVVAKDFSGSDEINIDSLQKYSIYGYPKTIKYPNLDSTQLRLYVEPSLQWHFNRGETLYDLNLTDISGFAAQLLEQSDKNTVSVILTEGRGMRKQTGQVNPHSWSIVDTEEFLKWIR